MDGNESGEWTELCLQEREGGMDRSQHHLKPLRLSLYKTELRFVQSPPPGSFTASIVGGLQPEGLIQLQNPIVSEHGL